MVNITLTNHNPQSQDCSVIININTGLCRFSDLREIGLKHLMNKDDFIHPLIMEPFTQTEDNLYHYEYNNIEELLYSGIYVYSRLLKADKPLACQFKINPTPLFKRVTYAEHIDFSINRHQYFKEAISIRQLEALTSHLLGFQFIYSEDYIIDDMFTIEDLPDAVNGDSFYETNSQLLKQLNTSINFSRYELRYISPIIGFGVFSKEIIKKGDFISFYTGVKRTKNSPYRNYTFKSQHDCLKMCLDASERGNIARFINHAPNHDAASSQEVLVEANVKALHDNLNGIEIILYSAAKEIYPGQQLLVDYGNDFFKNRHIIRFKTNGQPINTNKKLFWLHSQKKLNHLKIMAEHGVKKAQLYIRIRVFIIIFMILILMSMLHLLPDLSH